MKDWNEWVACNYYIGLRAHFGCDKFDGVSMIKNDVKMYTVDNYKKRKDTVLFRRLANYYKKDQFVRYITANILSATSSKQEVVRMHVSNMSDANLTKWETSTQSMSYRFKNEINKLLGENDFEELFKVESGTLPLILQKNISLETLTIIDSFVNFSKEFNKVEDHYIWPYIGYKIKNYNPLLQYFTGYDRDKYKSIMMNAIKGV